ncbi:Sialate O-acetylesterase [Geodia barretti]|uniref:Sialate O-acetylesterase n=1 Tax=Geodia barretti TaxID=519541 RepID=A0AA35RGQ7_GEOBA|nr:Sialate O-acetylesterase [Geodia barretti]
MVKVLVLLLLYTSAARAAFRFANYYGDHMVLQRAPAQANIWGYVDECAAVNITFNSATISATVTPDGGTECRWIATLPATDAVTPFTITATSLQGTITLADVLFGDVWVCSGQSNMQFTVPQAFNASEEEALADKYPNIRLFTAALMASDTPVEELLAVEQPWSVASAKTVGGGNWTYFSASCWFYGRNIYDVVQYPIGLVDTDWGGTPVEAWSSPDALAKCGKYTSSRKADGKAPSPDQPSVLWNAMIYPLLNMTIKGAVWYQGEANAGDPSTYNCTFPAMIDDWRGKWKNASQHTSSLFPFGFVQLAAYGSDNSSSFSPGFPVIRWAQTADYGFVPNPRLRAVFMAVAMDLGDPSSPFGSIHPRDKQDVGLRLALAGRAIAYGDSEVYFTGPLATTATMRYTSPSKHSQSYCNLSQKSFQILSSPLPSLLLSQVLTCRRWW